MLLITIPQKYIPIDIPEIIEPSPIMSGLNETYNLPQVGQEKHVPTIASTFVAEVAAKLSSTSCSSSSSCSRGTCEVSSSSSVLEVKTDAGTNEVAVTGPKLPFSEAGKLVGERHYGDWVINSKKLKTPIVIDEDVPDDLTTEIALPGCILL